MLVAEGVATLDADKDSPVGVEIDNVAGCTVVALSGELDIIAVGRVRSTLAALVADGASRVVVDLTGVDFMDSAGLGVLVMAHKRARVLRGRFAIVCGDGAVRRVLSLTGLLHVLQVFDTREAAIFGTDVENPPPAPS